MNSKRSTAPTRRVSSQSCSYTASGSSLAAGTTGASFSKSRATRRSRLAGPFGGVLPLPLSALKSSSAVLGNPLNYTRAVPLTYEQFRFAFANAVDESEAHELYEKYSVPGSGVPIFQAATANLNPWTEAQVDTKNPERGPLLIISGEYDHTVPWAIAHASFKQQEKNPGMTQIHEMPDRGHSLTIDHGGPEVAETALAFIAQQLQKGQ